MDLNLQELADKTVEYSLESDARYCDARAESKSQKSILIENGEIEYNKGKTTKYWNQVIKKLGMEFFLITNPQSFEQIKIKVDQLFKISSYLSQNKKTQLICMQYQHTKQKKSFRF